jgi:hypothetical protein
MSGDVHVRFCEGLGVKFPRATRLFCFSLKHLDHIVQTYVGYYNTLRPHQSLGNAPLGGGVPPPDAPMIHDVGPVHRRALLGGLLNHYERKAP